MDYYLAKSEIKKYYNINEISSDIFEIETNVKFDDFGYCYIALTKKNNELYLTDFANNLEDINLDENKIIKITKKYNIEFNNWHLECKYENLDSIKNYLNCLNEFKK